MSVRPKPIRVSLSGDKPLVFTDADPGDLPELTEEQDRKIRKLGEVLEKYRDAAERLLNSKYSHLKDLAPKFLVEPGNILLLACPEGVVIRFEGHTEDRKIGYGWSSESLSDLVADLSQGLIQCYESRPITTRVGTTGTKITLYTVDADGSRGQDFLSIRIGFDVVLERPDHIAPPPHKPFCIASVRNALEVNLAGELIAEGENVGEGQGFVVRSKIRLPVGWECIEIYPFLDIDAWIPDFAPMWAENDILAAVVARQIRDTQFQSLDPDAESRKRYADLLREFKALLDSEPEREEILQVFLKKHPYLLCPTQIRNWPKLAIGAHETDFVFRDANSDYLLVELERSTHPLFKKNGHARAELNEAISQITDWIRYIEDHLSTVQTELGLTDISTNPQSLVVIGRSHSLSAANRRKLTTLSNVQPKLRILTYDDVYDEAKAVIENLLGPIWDPGGETQIYYRKQV